MSEAEMDALRAAFDAQSALQRETDHRFKNVLQLISSVILLQSRRASDPAAQAALKSVLQRVSAVSVASRHIDRAAGAEQTDVTSLIREIATELASNAAPGVLVDLDLDPATAAARDGAPLALILNEALGNALAHAFPDGRPGRVRVALQRESTGFVLAIADDGVGAPEGGPPKGFGLTILQLMAQQVHGRLEMTATQPGFRLAVHVPMDDPSP